MIPYLRTEVLFCLAINGKLSKSMVEGILQKHTHHSKTSNKEKHHHRPEILQAFEYLKTKRLIKKLNTNPGPGLAYGRGRPKTYFSITEEGLKKLLGTTFVSAPRFWEIMYRYCLKNSPLTPNKVEECYQIVMRRYLKYPNRGFSSMMDIFHDRCNKWFQKAIIKSRSITNTQKIIEILAINPKVSKEKLFELMGNRSFFDYYIMENDYDDFIIRNVVRQNYNHGKLTYELSLFGVILGLVLIHHNRIGRLKCGLSNKQFSFEEYYNKIVSNYRTKLPLIFGKWDLLKEVLKELAIYNFIMILHKDEISSNSTNFNSVMLGGNKELCDSVITISSYNAKLMEDFLNRGEKFLEKAIRNTTDISDYEKTQSVMDKFREAGALLIPENKKHTDEFFEKTEQSFAEEITALYYMNLNNNIPLSAIIPKNHPLFSEHPEVLNHSPREYLSLIFQRDKEKPLLKEWFSGWMNDLTSLQQEISENTKKMALT
jgi:hypothetical protein